MLDLGFLPDVETILEHVSGHPPDHALLRHHARPGRVALARRFLTRPVHIRAEMPDESRTVPTTHQHRLPGPRSGQGRDPLPILQAEDRGLAMVFARTKRTADKVADDLSERGFAAAAVHGDLGQGAREQALRAFRAARSTLLVATDVAARGIDVAGRHPRDQLPVPRRREDLPAPHRPYRSRGRKGRGGHLRRLGRPGPLAADQRGAQAAVPRPAGDLLDLRPPLSRRSTSPARPRARSRATCAPGQVLLPSRSRTSARPAGGASPPPLHVPRRAAPAAPEAPVDAAAADPRIGARHPARPRRSPSRPGRPPAGQHVHAAAPAGAKGRPPSSNPAPPTQLHSRSPARRLPLTRVLPTTARVTRVLTHPVAVGGGAAAAAAAARATSPRTTRPAPASRTTSNRA